MNREAMILKDRRAELKLTQQELAVEAGMHIRQYQRYEYGESDISGAPVKHAYVDVRHWRKSTGDLRSDGW